MSCAVAAGTPASRMCRGERWCERALMCLCRERCYRYSFRCSAEPARPSLVQRSGMCFPFATSDCKPKAFSFRPSCICPCQTLPTSGSQWSARLLVQVRALHDTHLTMACRQGTAASGGAPSRGASAAAQRLASFHQGEGPGLQQQQACSKPLSPTASLLQDMTFFLSRVCWHGYQ